ncbi:MAG: DNA primase [Planctomycetota bacterium]|jgi:DNA primase|nr:DNA primase [Planctomycetota bacterium]
MPIYRKDFIERVKSASDLGQVAAAYNVQLKRVGGSLQGLCPFHNEKTPSFNIRTAEQYFYCFGCGAKGDVFSLVMKLEKVEFAEAVRLLAERAGLPLELDSPGASREAARLAHEKGNLLWCCSRALEYFEDRLAAPEGGAARDYLRSRGFTAETIARWRLGWAPDSWDGLSGFLLKNAKDGGQKEKVLAYGAEAGVLRFSEKSQDSGRHYYDAFRGRVMFPIMDAQSRPVAFGGRLLAEAPDSAGKYINSAETRIFEKKKTLFGFNWAAREMVAAGEAILVEGYVDVIMCHQYGIRNAVAVLGTALTESHAALLRRRLPENGRAVVFFDSDSAGEKATLRAISLFMSEDMPLAVAQRLELKDAGEFLPRYGPEKFREKLASAEDGFTYLLNLTIGLARGESPEVMGRAVRKIMEVVNLCPDPVKISLMRQRVAAEAGVPEPTLPIPVSRSGLGAGTGGGGAALPAGGGWRARSAWKPESAPAKSPSPAELLAHSREARKRREARLLRYLWESAEWGGRLVDAYPPDQWLDPTLAELAEHIRDLRLAGGDLSLAALAAGNLEPAAAERLAELAFSEAGPELSEKEFTFLLRKIFEDGVKDGIREIHNELSRAQKSGDAGREEELLRQYMRLRAIPGR